MGDRTLLCYVLWNGQDWGWGKLGLGSRERKSELSGQSLESGALEGMDAMCQGHGRLPSSGSTLRGGAHTRRVGGVEQGFLGSEQGRG